MWVNLIDLSVFVYVCVSRSVGDGSQHDVHHSLPADSQSGPRGLETSDVGLQLVIHVSDVGSFYFAPKQPDIRVIFKVLLNNNSPGFLEVFQSFCSDI